MLFFIYDIPEKQREYLRIKNWVHIMSKNVKRRKNTGSPISEKKSVMGVAVGARRERENQKQHLWSAPS